MKTSDSLMKILEDIEAATTLLLKDTTDKQLYLAEQMCLIHEAEDGNLVDEPEAMRNFKMVSRLTNQVNSTMIQALQHETLTTYKRLIALDNSLFDLHKALKLVQNSAVGEMK